MRDFELIIQSILNDGYAVSDNFLSLTEVSDLKKSFKARYDEGLFKEAKIGKLKEAKQDSLIRGDEILWLDSKTEIDSEILLLKRNAEFMDYLNSSCYLGITRSEFHYAKYSPGKFYKRHLDSFQSQKGRLFSVIYYLNENWIPSDGGSLIIYLNKNGQEEKIVIDPIGGRFVCFQSDKLEHEVSVTSSDRYSITGWLIK